jgi:uncharacterized protein YdhG (YjbR/CyaY superfamily)
MQKPKTVAEYINSFPEVQQQTLQKMRSAIKAAAPKAEELISYGIIGFRQNGVVAYIGGFKNHCSYFPASYDVIKMFADELSQYKLSKGTIQLPVDKPLPSSLVKKMVQAKLKENEAKQKMRSTQKKLSPADQ